MPYRLALIVAAAVAAPSVQANQVQKPAQPVSSQTSKADLETSIATRFNNFDQNGDGLLDTAEVAAAQSTVLQQRATLQQQRLEKRFEQLDTNKNDQLSLAEFKAAAAPVRASQTPAQLTAQLDSNKDGYVSLQEFGAVPLERFDKADRNNDGVITAAERRHTRQRR